MAALKKEKKCSLMLWGFFLFKLNKKILAAEGYIFFLSLKHAAKGPQHSCSVGCFVTGIDIFNYVIAYSSQILQNLFHFIDYWKIKLVFENIDTKNSHKNRVFEFIFKKKNYFRKSKMGSKTWSNYGIPFRRVSWCIVTKQKKWANNYM